MITLELSLLMMLPIVIQVATGAQRGRGMASAPSRLYRDETMRDIEGVPDAPAIDNHGFHKAATGRRWFARHPRSIRMSRPWLNLVERGCAALETQQLRQRCMTAALPCQQLPGSNRSAGSAAGVLRKVQEK